MIGFLVLALSATSAMACTAGNGRACLASSDASMSYFLANGFFATGDPCFDYSGGRYCFTHKQTNGYWALSSCSCSSAGSTYVDPCESNNVPSSYNWASQPYCDLSTSHTGCLYSDVSAAECEGMVCQRGITDSNDIAAILAKHNNLRADVANGRQAGQPGATNMKELTWNSELAAVAQLWADQCLWKHDSVRSTSTFAQVGQNMAISMAQSSAPTTINYDNMIQGWYDEVADLPASHVDEFQSGYVNGKAVGHYTQVVWATSEQVGCGMMQWKETDKQVSAGYPYQTMLVCNYGPAGNWGPNAQYNIPGRPIYTQGSAGADCAAASTNYAGLCA